MASQHSGAMPVQAHNDYEINRKAEEDGEFAGLKSCATYDALRGHPENPPGTVLFFRLQSGAMSTGRLNARCLRKHLFSETLRLIALIEEAAVIQRNLNHLHVPTEVPDPPPLVAEPDERQALARPRHSAPASWARRRGRALGGRRPYSMPARSTRTRTSLASTPARDRSAQVLRRRRYARSSRGRRSDEPHALELRPVSANAP